MKKMKQYIEEGLRLSIDDKPYTASHTTWNELREIIEQRYKEQGPGTEQEPIDFNDIDVSNIDSFFNANIGIFEGTKFEYIDISDWDVSMVEDMSCMFEYCENLKSVGNLSKWDVSKVKIMSWMFSHCKKLESVGDLSNWNILNVKYTESMFKKSGITNIPSWYKG